MCNKHLEFSFIYFAHIFSHVKIDKHLKKTQTSKRKQQKKWKILKWYLKTMYIIISQNL